MDRPSPTSLLPSRENTASGSFLRVFQKNPNLLSEIQKDTANSILEFYGPMEPAKLAGLTQSEEPWQKARRIANLVPNERGNQEIALADMQKYYSRIQQSNQKLAA